MKVAVFGATGQTGRQIVQVLVERQIPVRAVVRDRELAHSILSPEVERVTADIFDFDSLKRAIADCTVVICAMGAHPNLDLTGPFKVDYWGTKNLVDVSKANGIEHFVLVSSLCVSQFFHPLNLFWLVLFWKKLAENYIQASGLSAYTIVRPGGLLKEDTTVPILMQGADTLFEGRIPRAKVAQVCVEALLSPDARNKIVEIVTQETAPQRAIAEWFTFVS